MEDLGEVQGGDAYDQNIEHEILKQQIKSLLKLILSRSVLLETFHFGNIIII